MEIELVFGKSGPNVAATVVNSFSAIQIPPYWRAMEFLSGNLAAFPIGVYQDELEMDEQHYLDKLFSRRANPQSTARMAFKNWYFHGEHFGNGYMYSLRDTQTNDVTAIFNLLPEEVIPYRLIPDNGSLFDVEIWYWHGPSHKAFPAADILHYKPQVSHDGLVGSLSFATEQPTISSLRNGRLNIFAGTTQRLG
jgi:phage portal protein BeeE